MKVNVDNFDTFRNELVEDEPEWADADIQGAVRSILTAIGENPERHGLVKTPLRVAKMYEELTAGYHVDPVALINDAICEVHYD